MVSDTFFSSADKAAIIAVLQFPPAVLREHYIARIKRTMEIYTDLAKAKSGAPGPGWSKPN